MKLEPERVAQQFSRAAFQYDHHAHVQIGVARSLLAWLAPSNEKGIAVDVGAGTAPMAWQQRRLRPHYAWWALDLSHAMVAQMQARGRSASNYRGICANALAMPFATGSVNLLYSSFALQWCHNLPVQSQELYRVAAPGAELLMAVPVQGTLQEMVNAWGEVSDNLHVNTLATTQAWVEALSQAHWCVEDVVEQKILEHYPNVQAVAQQLKNTGANYVAAGKRGLMGKQQWGAFEQAYERLRQPQGLPVTWQVLMLRCSKVSVR